MVDRERPDVLHSYSFYTNAAAWIVTRKNIAIPVGSLRSGYLAERAAAGPVLGRLSSRLPGGVIANSLAAKDEADRAKGIFRPSRVLFVPNSVDLEAFSPAPWPESSVFQLLGIGRLYPQKAWDVAIRAMALVAKAGPSDVRLTIVGDGPLYASLRDLVSALDLEHSVTLRPASPDVAAMLARSHALVLSSDMEGTPNVVLEAMASARPVVATAVGDAPCIVQDNETGFLVPAQRPDLLAGRIMELANNRERAEAMGKAARKNVEKDRGPGALVDKTLAAYAEFGARLRPT